MNRNLVVSQNRQHREVNEKLDAMIKLLDDVNKRLLKLEKQIKE